MTTFFIRCTTQNFHWDGLQNRGLKLGEWLILSGISMTSKEYVQTKRRTGKSAWGFNNEFFIHERELKIPKI